MTRTLSFWITGYLKKYEVYFRTKYVGKYEYWFMCREEILPIKCMTQEKMLQSYLSYIMADNSMIKIRITNLALRLREINEILKCKVW